MYRMNTKIVGVISAIILGILLAGCESKYEKQRKELDKALAAYDFPKAYEVAAGDYHSLQKVGKAEIKYDIQNGNEEHAFQVAQERNLLDVYTENVQNAVTKYIHDKNFDKAIDILSTWQLESHSEFETKGYTERHCNSSNVRYNNEVNEYNEIINSLMNAAYQIDDQKTIERGLKLYKPNMVIKSKKLAFMH